MPFTPGIFRRAGAGVLAGIGKTGAPGRAVLGMGIGGIAGAVMSDSNTGTGRFESAVRGAALGTAAGALTSKMLWKKLAVDATGVAAGQKAYKSAIAAGAGKGNAALQAIGAGVEKNASRAYSVAKKGARLGGWGLAQANKIGGWALQHPTSALLLAGGGVAAYYGMKSGPGRSELNVDEMGQLAAARGLSSSGFTVGQVSSHQDFMNSTQGLVQGLHHGRH